MIHYLQEEEGIHLEVKARKIAQEVAVWQRSIGNFSEHFEGISEHGVFHGITICRKNNSLKKKDKNGLFTIERE